MFMILKIFSVFVDCDIEEFPIRVIRKNGNEAIKSMKNQVLMYLQAMLERFTTKAPLLLRYTRLKL